MKKNTILLICCCLALVLALGSTSVIAQNKIADEAQLRSLIARKGTTPVIVIFQVDNWHDMAKQSAEQNILSTKKTGSTPSPDTLLRSAIQNTADTIQASLPAGSYTPKRNFSIVPGMSLSVNEEALQHLAANPRVLKIYENKLESLPPITIADPAQAEPSDPEPNYSTPLIGADNAWSMGYTGSGVYVAVLDTGVRTSHEMFMGKSFVEACYSTDYVDPDYTASTVCPNGQISQTGPGSAAPNAGSHGTHVAGIAAGNNRDYSNGEALKGVAPDANIIAVQVFTEFTGTPCGGSDPCYFSFYDDQVAGLEYVYSLRNSHTIGSVNMSLGGGAYVAYCDATDPRTTIINQLRAAEIATAIATGNNGYCGAVSAPACISAAVAVGATDSYDIEALYNNYNATLQEIFAPGSDIRSSIATGDSAYESWSGTSMATPHVAGALAVLRQAFPRAEVAKIEEALLSSGTPITGLCSDAIPIPRLNVDLAAEGLTFPWAMFLPAMTGSLSQPFWGADNGVCCSGGWASFNLTSSGVTKHSVLPGCASRDATWEGWQKTSPGTRDFSWTITSKDCGSLNGSFSYTLQQSKQYLFYVIWTGSNAEIRVSIYDVAGAATLDKIGKNQKLELVADELIATINYEKKDELSSSDFECKQQ